MRVTGPLDLPVLEGGIAGLVTSAKAVQQQTLYRYQQVIQNAFREVDDGLIDQQKNGARLKAQTRQVDALRKLRNEYGAVTGRTVRPRAIGASR